MAFFLGVLVQESRARQAFAVAPLGERMQSSGCEDDSVETVSGDGTILKTASGHVYEINGADAVDVALWLPADDLLVCPTSSRGIYKIINTDEENEVAYGRRLR